MVLLLKYILAGLFILDTRGGGDAPPIFILGIGTLTVLVRGRDCRLVLVIMVGWLGEGEEGLSLSDPLEEGEGGKGEDGSDLTLPL